MLIDLYWFYLQNFGKLFPWDNVSRFTNLPGEWGLVYNCAYILQCLQWEGVMAPFWADFLISELGRPGTVDVVPDCWVLLAHLFEMCLCSNYPPMNLLIFLFETLKNYSMFLSYRGGFSIPPGRKLCKLAFYNILTCLAVCLLIPSVKFQTWSVLNANQVHYLMHIRNFLVHYAI